MSNRPPSFTQLGSLQAVSYDEQLHFMREEVENARKYATSRVHVLLSVVESIKAAREHNLNCSKKFAEKE